MNRMQAENGQSPIGNGTSQATGKACRTEIVLFEDIAEALRIRPRTFQC